MRTTCRLSVLFALALAATADAAVVVWQEDFSDVSDWFKIADDKGDSTLTSDGNLGDFYVLHNTNNAAFGPKTDGSTTLLEFDPAEAAYYSLHLTVDNIGWSVSYDVALDLFGATTNYVGTVWNVFPSWEPSSTFVGYTNVALGAFAFNPATVYVTPKITIHTGIGDQHVYFDDLHFEQQLIPEPAVATMILGGMALLLCRRRSARTP